jgi:hypothetical protein
MKRAGIMTLLAVAAALAAAGCGGATKTVVRTTTVTQTKTSLHTTPAKTPSGTTASTSGTTASRSGTTTSTGGRPLPAFIAGKWRGTKPSEIDFSGDAGNIVTGIHWSLWTPTTAVGEGTSGIQSCVPNCASGKVKYVPTKITLSAPSGGHFTRITETRNGRSLRATYGSPPWPLGAS